MKEWLQVTGFLFALFLWFLLAGVAVYTVHVHHGEPWSLITGVGFSIPLISGWWVLFADGYQ